MDRDVSQLANAIDGDAPLPVPTRESKVVARKARRKRKLRPGKNGPVSFRTISDNEKLSPMLHAKVPGRKKRKLVRSGSVRCSSLYVAIAPTCPATCPFRDQGCYPQAGFTKKLMRNLDKAAEGMTADEVVALAAAAIDSVFKRGVPQDGARGGRDLRLFESGDAGSETGARMLGASAERWVQRGGGTVWGYTHWWRDIPRDAFGVVKIAASVETVADADLAYEHGYLPALVVPEFQSAKAYPLEGSRNGLKLIPCPYETRGTTCVHCRLCLDRAPKNSVIGFAAHGPQQKKVKEQLIQLSSLARRGPR